MLSLKVHVKHVMAMFARQLKTVRTSGSTLLVAMATPRC